MNRCSVVFFLLGLVVLTQIRCANPQHVLFKDRHGVTSRVSYFDCCDDFEQQVIELDPNREVILLVHGCNASSGRFLTLKEVFGSHGQQTICYNYDYRARLEHSAIRLREALNTLTTLIDPPQITLIGHSQGGLVARRALSDKGPDDGLIGDTQNIRLVTISSPFNGIKASSHCGMKLLHILSGGLSVLICQGVAGAIWPEIHPRADFINDPGTMIDVVSDHLKIVTDEHDTCRKTNSSGTCLQSDRVFGLDEQYNPLIDRDQRVTNIELKVGHALVVGTTGHPPLELIRVLEEHDVMQSLSADNEKDEHAFLAQLY